MENFVLWDYLKSTEKNIFVYGLGLGCDKLFDALKEKNIDPVGIAVSNNTYKFPKIYNDKNVIKLNQVPDNSILLLAFGTRARHVLDELYYIAEKYEMYCPDTPVSGDGLFDKAYYNENQSLFDISYSYLEDDLSKKAFNDVIAFKLTGKIDYLRSCTSSKDEVFENIIKLSPEEMYVDLGAYNGDTIRELLHYAGSFKKATAFEPSKKNYAKLMKYLDEAKLTNVNAINIGVSDEEKVLTFKSGSGRGSMICENSTEEIKLNSVDNILNGEACSYLKMDVEGAEYEAILGAINTIKTHKPKLNIAIYHRNDDFFRIIHLIKEICPDYKIYVRHHEYIPAWDTNLYATI